MSRIHTSHVTHTHQSCHAYTPVMSRAYTPAATPFHKDPARAAHVKGDAQVTVPLDDHRAEAQCSCVSR